jgi:hypothetical protein
MILNAEKIDSIIENGKNIESGKITEIGKSSENGKIFSRLLWNGQSISLPGLDDWCPLG